MDPKMAQYAAGAAAFIVISAIVYWIVWQKKRIRVAFDTFSQKHRLDVHNGNFPTAAGETEGRFFSIGAKVHRSPMGRPQLQQVPDFWVQAGVMGDVPQGIVAGKRGRLQGAGPVQTGDAAFDKKVWVDCPDVEAAKAYLTAERQQALLELAKLDAVLIGPTDENIAMVARQTRGYTPKFEWLEERYNEFSSREGGCCWVLQPKVDPAVFQ